MMEQPPEDDFIFKLLAATAFVCILWWALWMVLVTVYPQNHIVEHDTLEQELSHRQKRLRLQYLMIQSNKLSNAIDSNNSVLFSVEKRLSAAIASGHHTAYLQNIKARITANNKNYADELATIESEILVLEKALNNTAVRDDSYVRP